MTEPGPTYKRPPLPVRLFDDAVYWAYHGGWQFLLAALAGAAITAAAFVIAGGRETFDDCVLNSVATATTQPGANEAYRACRRKHPDTAPR